MKRVMEAGRLKKLALAVVVLLAASSASWGQGPHEKSAEDILRGLLGGQRGVAGVVPDAGSENRPKGRIALPIHFAYDSAEISPDSFSQLHIVATALNDPRLHSARIGIEGHTDRTGSADYNLALSQRRADAVKDYLVQKENVSGSRLECKGFGESRPLPGVDQDTEEGRFQNRRVEFVNLGTGPAAAVPARPTSVDVAVNYERGNKVQTLRAGGVLTPRDNYRITFTPTRDSYVYIYQIDSMGKASIVFPNAEYLSLGNPVKAGRRHSVPPEGKWLKLDQTPGNEEIVVLASETELPDAQAIAARMHETNANEQTRGPAPDVRPDLAPEAPADIFWYRLPFKHQ
jgi:outer membrane protein OmpA-like peptidoglycan-associated protein